MMIMKSVTYYVQLIVGEGWRQLFGLDVMVAKDGFIQSALEQQKQDVNESEWYCSKCFLFKYYVGPMQKPLRSIATFGP